jgi:hypothetical protein
MRCSEKETCEKMGTHHLVSSVGQCTCISIIDGQKVPQQAQCGSMEHLSYSPNLLPPKFPAPMTKMHYEGIMICEH